jgi:CheY-like chemotaxis protein
MPFSTQRFVLVIEDEEIITQTFERVFAGQTYALLDVAKTAKEAIDKLKFMIYDMIWLDMKLDGNTYAGMEILRFLNRQLIKLRAAGQKTLDSTIIIMSASVSLQDIMLEANALDVFHFINKPVDFSDEYLLRVANCFGLPFLLLKSSESST